MSYLIARHTRAGYLVDPCPGCGQVHRHEQAGPNTADCGTSYVLVPDSIDHGQDRSLTRTGTVTPWPGA